MADTRNVCACIDGSTCKKNKKLEAHLSTFSVDFGRLNIQMRNGEQEMCLIGREETNGKRAPSLPFLFAQWKQSSGRIDGSGTMEERSFVGVAAEMPH